MGSADTRERGQESAEGRPGGREGGLGGREAQRPREFKGRGRKNLRDSGVQRRTLKAAAGREAVEKHSCRAPCPAHRAPHPAPRARAALAASRTRGAQGHKPGKANGDHTE